MASTSLTSQIVGYCIVNVKLLEHSYTKVKLAVLKDLCADVVVGHDLLKHHSQIQLDFGGKKSPLTLCSLAHAQIEPPPLFNNLTDNVRPIATKSRRHSINDRVFIQHEVEKLLSEGVIEESRSPWRAQVLVTTNQNHKRRMVIDYSQTINRFTLLDAYPLPNIEYVVSQVSKYSVFSTIDLSSAYHQIPLLENEKKYTAFEAGGKLYQFTRIPFGVTNGVACFQRVIDNIIRSEELNGTFAYLDDITVCGKDQKEHDINLNKFTLAVNKFGLTINDKKSRYSLNTINLLGYEINNKAIRPDQERLKPLLNLPLPTDMASLRRTIGMLSHYSKWVPRYSDKVRSLVQSKTFPLSPETTADFENLKQDIIKSAISAVDENIPFDVETDASEHSIGASLSQNGRPVAFFSRALTLSEQRHSSIEKEAYAIVEALKKWRHFLIGRHFRLITDQKSISFMFDSTHTSKIKNEKILRWRLELACYHYDIVYRPGRQNVVADTLSRVCGSTNINKLYELHSQLSHPGVTRMAHWVRSRNLPYSLEEVRKMTASCPICAELKPRFYRSQETVLVKATAPFERLNMDFKGPLPTNSKNKYLLTIVDEFSRFPFAYPCPDMTSSTVTEKLCELFCLFGLPSYIHTDRGSSFMSKELKGFLNSKGIATSRTTPYNPQGNGQVERYNGIIWKAITLLLKTRNLRINEWECVLNDSLHSIRSLLCTATNLTPHERMFIHSRKSSNGQSLPTWLLGSEKVFLKRNVRQSKYDPLVDEVDLIDVNPNYATVRFDNGDEKTVSLRQLAPRGEHETIIIKDDTDQLILGKDQSEGGNIVESQRVSQDISTPAVVNNSPSIHDPQTAHPHSFKSTNLYSPQQSTCSPQLANQSGHYDHTILRRSSRTRHPPKYLEDYSLTRRGECGE